MKRQIGITCFCLIFLFSCLKPDRNTQDFENMTTELQSFFGQKLGCSDAFLGRYDTYNYKTKEKSKVAVLNLCHCDSVYQKNIDSIMVSKIINYSSIFFDKIKYKEYSYYMVEIYDDVNRKEMNKTFDVAYDSIRKVYYRKFDN